MKLENRFDVPADARLVGVRTEESVVNATAVQAFLVVAIERTATAAEDIGHLTGGDGTGGNSAEFRHGDFRGNSCDFSVWVWI